MHFLNIHKSQNKKSLKIVLWAINLQLVIQNSI